MTALTEIEATRIARIQRIFAVKTARGIALPNRLFFDLGARDVVAEATPIRFNPRKPAFHLLGASPATVPFAGDALAPDAGPPPSSSATSRSAANYGA